MNQLEKKKKKRFFFRDSFFSAFLAHFRCFRRFNAEMGKCAVLAFWRARNSVNLGFQAWHSTGKVVVHVVYLSLVTLASSNSF
jgi:hypothetical protein